MKSKHGEKTFIRTKIITGLLILISLIQVIDLFGASDTFQQRFYITSNVVLFTGIAFFAIIRLLRREPVFPSFAMKIAKYSFLILFPLSVFLTILDQLFYVNFVFSLLHINYDQLGFNSIALGLVWVINQRNTFFFKHRKLLIGIAPVLFMGLFYLMYLWPYEVMRRALHEDGPIEWLQVFFLVVACVFALLIAQKLYLKKQLFLTGIYIIVALGLFFIAGEEFSWGQRLLDIATPEYLVEMNRQKEITVHNIRSVESTFLLFQIWLNIYAAFAFILTPFMRKISTGIRQLYIPGYYYFFYFIPTPLYYFTSLKVIFPYIPEVVEVLCYFGIAIFLLENYYTNPLVTKKK